MSSIYLKTNVSSQPSISPTQHLIVPHYICHLPTTCILPTQTSHQHSLIPSFTFFPLKPHFIALPMLSTLRLFPLPDTHIPVTSSLFSLPYTQSSYSTLSLPRSVFSFSPTLNVLPPRPPALPLLRLREVPFS